MLSQVLIVVAQLSTFFSESAFHMCRNRTLKLRNNKGAENVTQKVGFCARIYRADILLDKPHSHSQYLRLSDDDEVATSYTVFADEGKLCVCIDKSYKIQDREELRHAPSIAVLCENFDHILCTY